MASARAGAAAGDDEDDMDSVDAYKYAEYEALLEELYSPSESDLHAHDEFSWIMARVPGLFSHVCVSNSVPAG